MGVRFFRGQKTKFEHEHRQIKEIAALLRKEFPNEPVYLLTSVLVANGQIDCIILTKNGPLVLELKAFRGEIRGVENGRWEIVTKDGPIPVPNIFIQAKIHRQDFIDRMIPVSREHFPHIGENNLRKIGSWLYFCKGSTYPDGQIDFRRVKWFRIVTADTLLEKLRYTDSGYTLRIQDMDEIVKGFGLEEYSFDSDKPLIPVARTVPPKKRISRGIIISVVIILIILALVLVVLFVPGTNVALTNVMQGVLTLVLGTVQSVTTDMVKSGSTDYDSRQAVIYLNDIRIQSGVTPVPWDERAYYLAFARADDMANFSYLGYVNPVSGMDASALKAGFGISGNESVTESDYGQWNGYSLGIEKQAINSWISDEGNRNRLLGNYSSGAVACSKGYCSFIGVGQAELFPYVNISALPVNISPTADAGLL